MLAQCFNVTQMAEDTVGYQNIVKTLLKKDILIQNLIYKIHCILKKTKEEYKKWAEINVKEFV